MLPEEDGTTEGVLPFDEKLSAIDNLKNLTLRLEATGNSSSYCTNNLSTFGYTVFPNVCENKR